MLEYQLAAFHLEGMSGKDLRIVSSSLSLLEDERPMLRRLALSLGLKPAPFLLAVVEGEKGSITGQIAAQMSIAAIEEKAQELAQIGQGDPEKVTAPNIVREVFREANLQVYQYAHRMRVGGQVGATGFVCAYDGERFAVAKVGGYEHYLLRNREFIRLHARCEGGSTDQQQGMLQRFIGANSQILVDLASVLVKEGDRIVVTSLPAQEEFDIAAQEILNQTGAPDRLVLRLAGAALHAHLTEGRSDALVLRRNIFCALLQIGRPVISLTQVIET